MDSEMAITIDGEEYEIESVFDNGLGVKCIDAGDTEWNVAENAEEAGKAARQYWVDKAENDQQDFICLVGADNLVSWAMGNWAGPGSVSTESLEEWFDLWLDIPEEQWGGYDGMECTVDKCSEDLEDELGFMPTVAYRCH